MALSDWCSKAEKDLLRIVGSDAPPAGRGETSKFMKINSTNIFKCPEGGVTKEARALRWLQLRVQELRAALTAWHTNTTYPASATAFRRVKGLVDATHKNGILQTPLIRMSHSIHRSWECKLTLLFNQTLSLVRLTGFRRPVVGVVKAIIAQCVLFSGSLAADAKQAECMELASGAKAGEIGPNLQRITQQLSPINT